MPGLLDLLSDPVIAAGAGLLTPTPGSSFGGGLLQGIGSYQQAQQAQQANALNQLRQQQAQLAITEAQQKAENRKASQKFMDEARIRASAFDSPGGEQILPEEINQYATSMLYQPGMTQTGVGLLNATKPAGVSTKLATVMRNGQPHRILIDQLGNEIRDLGPTTGPQSISVDLSGLAEKERTKDLVDAENKAINKVSKLREFDTLTGSLARAITDPNATVGTVGRMVRGIGTVQSQIEQAFANPDAVDLSGLSSENRDFVETKLQSGDIESLEITLAYAIASQRESGKFTDRDIELARRTAESGDIDQYLSKLISVRDQEVGKINRNLRTQRTRRDAEDNPAFQEYVPESPFTVEDINGMPFQAIQRLFRQGKDRLGRLLTPEQQDAFAARFNRGY